MYIKQNKFYRIKVILYDFNNAHYISKKNNDKLKMYPSRSLEKIN